MIELRKGHIPLVVLPGEGSRLKYIHFPKYSHPEPRIRTIIFFFDIYNVLILVLNYLFDH